MNQVEDEWGEWKTRAFEILGVTMATGKPQYNYDCFDEHCKTRYFNKSVSLQAFISHVKRIHECVLRECPEAGYLPRRRVTAYYNSQTSVCMQWLTMWYLCLHVASTVCTVLLPGL